MNVRPFRRFLAAALLLAAPLAFAAGEVKEVEIGDLAFIAGSWRMAGPPAVEEHWMQPTGDTLIGMGRVSGDGRTFFFEYLRIEKRPDGIFYVAQPKGGPPTDFKLVRLAPGEAVFENPQHDFPKRILYRRLPNGQLLARTEGDGTEKEQPAEFLYDRLKD